MKKIVITAALALAAFTASAQKGLQYDSLSNFVGQNPSLYKGQTLYIKENAAAQAAKGYEGFGISPDFDRGPYGRNVYAPVKSASGTTVSNYQKLKDQYVTVTNVYTHTNEASTRNAISNYLQLVDNDGETFYYGYDAFTPESFNNTFVVVGFFEKSKSALIGHEFLFTGRETQSVENYKGLRDLASGSKRTDVKANTSWRCTDVSIDDSANPRVVAVLENPDLGKVYVAVEDLQNTSSPNAKFTTSGAVAAMAAADKQRSSDQQRAYNDRLAEYQARFGETNGKLIADGKVAEGMTKEMVTLAKGTPINSSNFKQNNVDVEQWNYDDGWSFYFRNGKVYKTNYVPPYKSGFSLIDPK